MAAGDRAPSGKQRAWPLFDAVVAESPFRQLNPWEAHDTFAPDYETLRRLLGVPLLLGSGSTSGVPALALDVWVAHELRRAGLHPDAVWPRAEAPRVIPRDILAFVDSQPARLRDELRARLRAGGSFGSTVGGQANLLGKNYLKQVDVIMSHWSTGPEIMISTKRMDSSFAKNAANRVEESYGDAKNLRLRHPQAACGFVYGLRSTCWEESPDKAAWLLDLLAKLGREEDAYHAVALVVPQYGGEVDETDPGGDAPVGEPVVGGADDAADVAPDVAATEVQRQLRDLPLVGLRHDLCPPELDPSRFFRVVIDQVLASTPVDDHPRARELRGSPRG